MRESRLCLNGRPVYRNQMHGTADRPFCYEDNGEGDTVGIGLRYVRLCLEGFYHGEAILTINSEIGRGTKG